MKFLAVLGLLSVCLYSVHADDKCHMSTLFECDDYLIDYMHSLPKATIPETDDEVQAMCGELNKVIDCAFGYINNCTTPLQKEVINLILEGILAMEKEFCTPGSSPRARYLAHAACLNKVSKMDVVKDLMTYMLAVLDKARNVPVSERIVYSCCGYSKVYTTLINFVKDDCGQDALDASRDLLVAAISPVLEVMCNGFDGGNRDDCKALLPPEGSKPSDDANQLEMYKYLYVTLSHWLD